MRGLHPDEREKTRQEIEEKISKLEYVDGYKEKILEDFNKLCDAYDKLDASNITESDRTALLESYQNINADMFHVIENGYASLEERDAFHDLADSFSVDSTYLKQYDLGKSASLYDIESDLNLEVERFNIISEINKDAADATKEVVDTTAKAVMEKLGNAGKHDDMRYMNKAMLLTVARNYEKYLENMTLDSNDTVLAGNIDSIKTVITDIREYCSYDATIGSKDPNEKINKLEREKRVFEKIYKELDELDTAVQKQSIDRDAEDYNYNDVSRITSNLLMYFEGQRNGNLTPVPDSEITVDSTGVSIARVIKGMDDSDIKQADAPLFPHDPSYNDIKQGALGDCYLISSLSSIAIENANKIKESMVDNGDGTVTVRFWQKNMPESGIPGSGDTYTPIYVKVDKVTPEVGAAQGCVWVQTLERAYAASGLSTASNYTHKTYAYNRAVPKKEELEKMYNEYSKLPRHELPSHTECPWLIDEGGNLHKYAPQYADIDGGASGIFIEHFLGQGYQSNRIDMDDLGKREPDPISSLEEVLINSCKEAGLFKNQLEITQYTHDLNNNFDSTKRFELVYRLIKNSKDAKLPAQPNGDIDLTDDDVMLAFVITSDMQKFITEVARPEIAAKTREPRDMTGMSEFMINIKSRPDDNHLSYHRRIFGNDELKNKYAGLMYNVERNLKTLHEDFKEYPKYSGEYNNKEKELFQKISKALKKKNPVTLATRTDALDTGDKNKLNGMNYKHAYTVTGVVEKEVNGKMLKFLQIRNPHARTGRNYGVENGQTVAYEDARSKEGEGYIELGDVLKECSDITINEKLYPDKLPTGIVNPVTAQDISKYMRCIESISEQFDAKSSIFGKDSPEYVFAHKHIEALQHRLPDSLGKDMSELANLMQFTDNAMEKYLKHCDEKKIDNSTRNKRMDGARAFRQLYKDARANIKDPARIMKEQTARTITTKLLENSKKQATPGEINQYTNKIMESKEFRKSYGKGNYLQIHKVNQMDEGKILKTFVAFSKELNAPAPKVQTAQVSKDAPVKVNDAPQKQGGGMAIG